MRGDASGWPSSGRRGATGAWIVVLGLSFGALRAAHAAEPAEPVAVAPSATVEPAPEPHASNDDVVERLLAEAQDHLDHQRFEPARVLLDAAYRLDPGPPLLWARAQAARWAGDCIAAIDLYEQYIAAEPGTVEIHHARANVERCRAELAAAGIPSEPVPPPEPSAPEVVVEPAPPPPSKPAARHRDRLGIVLLASGGSLLGLGAGSFTLGAVTSVRADRAPTEDEFGRRLRASRVELGVGGALVGIGVALTTWGVVRLVRHRRAASGFAAR
jgi:hypothetical protein